MSRFWKEIRGSIKFHITNCSHFMFLRSFNASARRRWSCDHRNSFTSGGPIGGFDCRSITTSGAKLVASHSARALKSREFQHQHV
ncbi:unnamed protein product [Prunus brigantina]